MASSAAIAATSNAICLLLGSATGGPRGVSASVTSAEDLRTGAAGAGQRLWVHLFHVGYASVGRALAPPPHGAPAGPPALALELHYLLVADATDVLTEQHMLGWGMRVLADSPVLEPALLNAFQPAEPVFADDEAVELIAQGLTHAELASAWQVAPARRRPAAAYLASPVCL